jgi:two-component system alkaline phosphatase synthesis response regulator PhoP
VTSKVLIVDDDKKLVRLIEKYLNKEGFQTRTANDGSSGLSEVMYFNPDVIILDIMMPDIDGIEFLSRIRPESNTYVIMLTAKSELTDKIIGLGVGADDYMTKPFSPRELVARIRAAIRRLSLQQSNEKDAVFTHKRLVVNTAGRTVRVDNTPIDLTKIEFDLLETLIRNANIVLSREKLIQEVWGFDYSGDTRMVDVHIGNLRKKIDMEIIETVRGIGYKFIKQ